MPSPCALTQGYVQDCQEFFGGVNVIHIIEFQNIVQPVVAVAGVVTTLTKVATMKFQKYQILAHSAEADDKLSTKVDAGTISVKQSIKFPINGLSVTVRNEIALLAKNRLVFVIEDNNGNAWLYGTGFGLRMLTADAKMGKALLDKNGYDLVFEGEEKVMAFKLDPAAVATLQIPGV